MTNEDLIISLQKQTRKDITDLAKSVSRTNSKVAANGVKLDSVLEYNKKCDGRLGELEEWKATHSGVAIGLSRKASRFNSKTALICTIGATVIAFAGLWFSVVSPALEVKAGIIEKIETTDLKYQELMEALDSLK